MRCYFMRNGHIVDVEAEELMGLSEREAIERARELFAARKADFDGFEVWEGTRVVIREPPQATNCPESP